MPVRSCVRSRGSARRCEAPCRRAPLRREAQGTVLRPSFLSLLEFMFHEFSQTFVILATFAILWACVYDPCRDTQDLTLASAQRLAEGARDRGHRLVAGPAHVEERAAGQDRQHLALAVVALGDPDREALRVLREGLDRAEDADL